MKVNFNVTNQLATPAIHAAALANRPAAGQPGRLFVDTDNPSTGIYRDTGTVWLNITGGAGGGNLQTVTDAGNTTDNNIILTYPNNTLDNALVFYNDQLAQEEYIIEKRGTGITTNDALVIQSRGNISPSTQPCGIMFDGANDVIKSFYTTSFTELGFKLDFANYRYYIGDYTYSGISNGVSFVLFDDTNTSDYIIKSTYQGNDIGLKLDFASFNYYLGDFNGLQNSAYIYCNNDTSPGVYAYSEGSSSMAIGNHTANLGDWSFAQNGTIFYVNDSNQIIKTKNNGNDIGLKLDFANDQYQIGAATIANGVGLMVDNIGKTISTIDYTNGINGFVVQLGGAPTVSIGDSTTNYNGTFLIVNDSNQYIEVSNNLKSATAGGSSGQHLKIRVGGVDYKIALLNP